MKTLLPFLILVELCLFAFDLQAADWTQQTTPVPRPTGYTAGGTWDPQNMKIVYDSRRNVTVGIGGYANPPLPYLPVSEYNGAQWISRAEGLSANSPSGRTIGGAVFDSVRGVTVVYGGYVGTQFLDELWEYNGNSWVQRTWTGPGPAAYGRTVLCYDPHRARIICLKESFLAYNTFETWEWTGSAWERGPDLPQIDVSAAEMVFDIARNRAFVYSLGTGRFTEYVWEYVPSTHAAQGVWQAITTSGSPFEGRVGVSLVYHSRLNVIFRIGGRFVSNIYSFTNDTQVWDATRLKWVQLIDGFFPDASRRAFANSCFDEDRGVIELYRGALVLGDGTVISHTDMWEWNDQNPTDTWLDFSYISSPRDGTPTHPWNTLRSAIYRAPVGGTIYLKAGISSETINSRDFRIMPVVLKAVNGPVTIGQ
jgi:hypothetical protein